jgi:hypothetical protein
MLSNKKFIIKTITNGRLMITDKYKCIGTEYY